MPRPRRQRTIDRSAAPGRGIPSKVMRTSAAHRAVDNRNVANMTIEPTPAVSGVSQLFQLLRDGVPRTRAELAKSTGLARSTIAARVDELMRMGLITPIAETVSTGGRPPSQFALNPSARLVLAADIGASHATLAITDLAGSIIDRAQRAARRHARPRAGAHLDGRERRRAARAHRSLDRRTSPRSASAFPGPSSTPPASR